MPVFVMVLRAGRSGLGWVMVCFLVGENQLVYRFLLCSLAFSFQVAIVR